MTISIDEMRRRANAFALAHKNDANEDAEKQSYLNDFFQIFDIRRSKVATFEYRVTLDHKTKTNKQAHGKVDLLWKKNIAIEMKSLGKDLNRAKVQAFNYVNNLPSEEVPSVVLCCDFQTFDREKKTIYTYETVTGDPTENKAKHINPYLLDSVDVFIPDRSKPISQVPLIKPGNKPIDNNQYVFKDKEKENFLKQEPDAEKYFYRWWDGRTFIRNQPRWCLYLGKALPSDLMKLPKVRARIQAVRQYRLQSKSEPTQKIADTPTRYHVENIPTSKYLAIPQVSSERRRYIPIGFMKPDVLCSNQLLLVDNATIFHFGVLTSAMQMAWTRCICGRMKSDYRYSAGIVYNNFPWVFPNKAEKKLAVETAAQKVLDVRDKFFALGSTLLDLYDPDTMPPELLNAHKKLDKAVDNIYRSKPFANDNERVSFLFALYDKMIKQSNASAGSGQVKAGKSVKRARSV